VRGEPGPLRKSQGKKTTADFSGAWRDGTVARRPIKKKGGRGKGGGGGGGQGEVRGYPRQSGAKSRRLRGDAKKSAGLKRRPMGGLS